ncbi:protein DBF4 homolog A isoform X2 [Pyxicephalus adspersus]|uniref:protein DBF4 homolog A isoform X2 n=1 Tax=Pyxicephalus adspersus TaxID=30357 RepID=UPI003B595837
MASPAPAAASLAFTASPAPAAASLAFTASPAPAAETTNVGDEDCKQKGSTAIQICSSEPDIDDSIKKLKLDKSLESVTLLSAPVDANYVARRKPVLYTVPKGLKTTCPSNTLHAQSDPSSSSSPSKLHRWPKKTWARKAGKQKAEPSCKVSAPVEHYDVSSYEERVLSLFGTSEMQSEFCGFSSKSANLPHGVDVEDHQPSSKGDFDCLVPTLNPLWKEKEIAEPPSSQEDCPLESILTKLNIPLDAASADADCRAITNPDPLPMDSIFSLQTLDNTGRVADSFTLPPGAANHLAFSGSPAPAAETTNVCDENCKRKVSTAIQKCSSEPDIDCSIKKIKLDSSLESVTLLSAPVDANDVARRKPVLYTVPKGLNTTCPSNTLHAQSDPSSSSSPSKLHRKVKRLSRKARKKTSQAAPSCKVSAPVEQYDVSSSKQRILSLFETSDMQSEFCGFSSKSANLPQSMDVKDDQPSSKGDFDWCIFATTSSSAETFHGF